MRIVSLSPSCTDILEFLGAGSGIVGCDARSVLPESCKGAQIIRLKEIASVPLPNEAAPACGTIGLDPQQLRALQPDIVFIEVSGGDSVSQLIEGEISSALGRPICVVSLDITTLDSMYGAFEVVGRAVGKEREGRELAHRVKAQLMDWGDNFYPRMRNKRVTVLSSVSPLRVAGRWIPDLIRNASGSAQHFAAGEEHRETTWAEIVSFRPDVVIVAPEGYSLEESVRTLRYLERAPDWEQLPAVKRGEVVFADGVTLFTPGPRFLRGAAIVISAMAGLESGYITNRDEFYRLRYIELHRHRLL